MFRHFSMKFTPTWVGVISENAHCVMLTLIMAGWYSKVIGYGMTYGQTDVLSQVEVSYILVAALIAMDTPRQIAWHMANAQHGGATVDETKAIRKISMLVAEQCGVKWREGVPEV